MPNQEVDIPVYKVSVAGSSEYFEQRIDGTLGRQLTREEAATLRSYKAYSPALVEAAIRAGHGFDAWPPVFDELLWTRGLPGAVELAALFSGTFTQRRKPVE